MSILLLSPSCPPIRSSLLKLALFANALLSGIGTSAQVTIFSENMGTPGGNTAIATHDTNNGFQNSAAYAFTGTGDVRTSTTSTGYAGASGGGNVFLTSSSLPRTFIMAGINTSGYTDLSLSFGAYKSANTPDLTTLQVDYSTDAGTNWSPLTFPTQPTGTGTSNWRLITITGGTIPAVSDLWLRWSNTTADLQPRIDDIVLTGILPGGCGITLGSAFTNCDANTAGIDTYTLSIPYTGMNAGTVVVNNSGSGTVGGDDPASVSDGTITVSGITEGTGYSVTFTAPCDALVVSGSSPACDPICGLALGAVNAVCNSLTAGPVDNYDLSIAYTGSQAGVTVINNSGSGTVGGDDPAVTANGTIVISGISEADTYDVTFSAPCASLNAAGAAPNCEPAPPVLAAWDFTGETSVATSTAEIYVGGLDASNLITRGAGAAASAGGNSFRTAGFQNNGISTANTDHFQFTLSATAGNTMSLSGIVSRVTGTGTFAASPGVSNQFAYSLDGSSFTLIGSPSITIGTNQTFSVDLSGEAALQNVAAGFTVTLRYYASGQTGTGGWGFFSDALGNYGLAVLGTVDAAGSCGITPGSAMTVCDANTPGTDTYTLSIPYIGMDAGTTVVNNSGSGTVGGDDPADVMDGTITVSGITEGTPYSVTFTAPCDAFTVSGASPVCAPACGITMGLVDAICNSITEGPGDTYDLTIAYTGSEAGVTVINNSGSGTVGGDDPSTTPNGTITISGIAETDAYDITFTAPCGSLNAAGAAPDCDPVPTEVIINFDNAANWTAGSVALGSYATNHIYAESNWSFTGGDALRNGTAVQDGFPGALDVYSWRLRDNAAVVWNATYNGSETITRFGFDVRRWDGSPAPAYAVTYSTNGGSTFSSTILTIDNTFLQGSSAWTTFAFVFPGAVQLAPGNLIVRVAATGATERIMIDNFLFDTGAVACALALSPATVECETFTSGMSDTYSVTIPYLGSQAGTAVVNNSGSGSIGGDDPALVTNGTIIISGLAEGTGYSITFTSPCETLVISGSSPICEPPPSLVINEIDYDQAGDDLAEFVEIKNTGASAVDLTGMKLQLMNGSSNSPYAPFIVLNSVMLAAGDYYVVGSANVPNVDQVVFNSTTPVNSNLAIQNGAPDGVRLTTATDDIIDQMSYEGDMISTEGISAGTDPGNGDGAGLARFPDGIDTGDNSVDFVLACNTPGEANTFVDSDADGTVDCLDVCPMGPEPGSPCDDGDANTAEDTVQSDCSCSGILVDCEGVPDGPAVPGTPCIDGNPFTINDVYQADCSCLGVEPDCLGIPGGPNVPGAPCNDFIASTNDETYDMFCQCTGTPCSQNVTLELRSDENSSQMGWEIVYQNDNTVVCSGGTLGTPYIDGITSPITEPCCLPIGCFRLRVFDSGGDGFASGGVVGGYQLRESGINGRRIIDNMGNFANGASSAIASTYDNGAFCVPIGDDRTIFSSCDKLDWVTNKFIVASENAAVSAQYGVSNATSGYVFWFYDPNGTYSYRRFRNHATSDGYGTGATRACHFRVNGWVNTPSTPHLPANVLLNVRIRGRVAGTNLPFGPACLFKIDPALAACPIVKLQDNPLSNDFSCGVSKFFGGSNQAGNRITANPPQPIPSVSSANVRYQFRFRNGEYPNPEGCIVRPPQTSATFYLNWSAASGTQLQCNTQYQVDVRVSLDGGATWCVGDPSSAPGQNCADPGDLSTAWGKMCTVNITTSTNCSGFSGGTSNVATQNGGDIVIFPNPNRGDELRVVLTDIPNTIKTVSVDIYDLTGKRVMMRNIAVIDGYLNTTLDLNGELASGLYMVNIKAGATTLTERLVIQP